MFLPFHFLSLSSLLVERYQLISEAQLQTSKKYQEIKSFLMSEKFNETIILLYDD